MSGILETILANQIAIMAHLGLTQAASSTALTSGEAATAATGPSTITGNTPTNVAPGANVELDSAGLPWDERIHSSSKEKLVKDSTWKLKRGVDKALVDQVQAEQRAAGFGTPPSNAPANVPPVVPDAGAASVPGAAAPGVNLPGMPGLPGAELPVAPQKVKVEMPAYVAGAEIDDTLLTTIASAFYAEYGEANLNMVLQQLFKLQPGQPVTAIVDPAHRDSLWRLVTTQEYLDHYKIVKPQA